MKNPLQKFLKSASSFVVIVGDDGAIMVYIQNGKVTKRMYAPSAEPEHMRDFEDALKRDPKAPISLLVDMMDQSYVQQTLPPVSSLSINKLIKRRLERDFGTEDITGALALGREKEGRKDWNFLFIALANTPQLAQWIDFLIERPNPFAGIYLAPVEAEFLIGALSKSISARTGEPPAQWQLLVNHHKVGGFRQIVLKNGKLVFTRLAQPVGESLPAVIAGNIEQEVLNTIEYLKRLSFQGDSQIDVIVITSQDIKYAIDSTNIKVHHFASMTPYEVTEMLQLEDAALPADRFGDVVLAAHFGNVRKHRLKFNTSYGRKLEKLSAVRKGVRTILTLGIAASLIATIWTVISMQPALEDISHRRDDIKEVNNSIEKIKKDTAGLPGNIEHIISLVDLKVIFGTTDHDPLTFIAGLTQVLDNDLTIPTLKWNYHDEILGGGEGAGAKAGAGSGKEDISFDVAFPNLTDRAKLLTRIDDFFKRVKQRFEKYEVTYSNTPGLTEEQSLEVNFDSQAPATPETRQPTIPIQVTMHGNESKPVDMSGAADAATGAPGAAVPGGPPLTPPVGGAR